MPVTMSGMASGMDTDAIIQKLVNVESKPIQQLEIRKKKLNNRKEGLRNLSRQLNDISNTAKDLFGVRASFTEKSAVSSDSSALDAKATKFADKGVKKIKVIQLATSHKIATDPVWEKEQLPAGTFTIEVDGSKKTINFKGGTLKKLFEKIESAASEIVMPTYMLKGGDTYVLTITSRKSGEKGEIRLTGDKELLTKIGLIGGEAKERKSEVVVSFDSRYFTSYMGEKKPESENGNIKVGDNGKSVAVQGLIWREYALPVELAVKADTNFEFDVSYHDKRIEEEAGIPKRLRIGPKERINIKGIILEGYNPERKRERKKEDGKVLDSLMGIGLVSMENEKRVEKIYPISRDLQGTQTIAVGKDFKGGKIYKIVIYCNRGVMDISNVRLVTPMEQKPGFVAKNTIAAPQDAKLSVDGVELTRDRNDNLSDVIKGITLNLKRPTSTEVDLSIEPSIDLSIEKIKKFVDAYNKYLDLNRELTKAAISQKPGDYEKNYSQSGLFVGDMTLMRLEGTLQTTVNSAYPNSADNPIKVFPQMGVSTGAINAEWESIKSGKLIIDEALLKRTILENPEGVASFFGSDSDGDNRPDNGMAVKVVSVLKPYISGGKNIIAAKIELEDNSIKLADDSIKQKEDHLKKYEEKLKRKFATMEQAINQTNAQKQWMKYQLGGGSENEVGGKEK
jgi:flagellar hook-associated protein 2